jgi:hypothetical protein
MIQISYTGYEEMGSVKYWNSLSTLAMFYSRFPSSQCQRRLFMFYYTPKTEYTLLSTLPYPMMHCGGNTLGLLVEDRG